MKITGGCHCGKITYEAEISLDNVVICHCTDCQSLSGSAFRTVVFSETDAFTFLTGEPGVYVKTGDSGNKRSKHFVRTVDLLSILHLLVMALNNME